MAPHENKTWRLLIQPDGDAATNMATDLALLRCVRQPVLRLYTWKPWAVSLGYHQAWETLDIEKCRREGLDVVRRPTGGRAVLHAEELTYCVVLPRTHQWYTDSVVACYRTISMALLNGLRSLQLPVEAMERASTGRNGTPVDHRGYMGNPSCFASGVRFEIALRGRKLVGSAQRRFQEGILQHGSILLGPAYRRLWRYLRRSSVPAGADHAVSIAEVTGELLPPEHVIQAIRSGFEQALQLTFTESGLTPEEQEMVVCYQNQFRIIQGEVP